MGVGSIKLPLGSNGIGPVQEYTIPADWIDIESMVTEGDEKFVGVYAVYDYDNGGSPSFGNVVTVKASGDYTVDWGDGTFPSNVVAGQSITHIYLFADLDISTQTSDGFRQAVVTITPQAGNQLTQLDLSLESGFKPNYSFYKVTNEWTNIKISGQNIATLILNGLTASLKKLEKFKFVGANLVTNFGELFGGCYSLKSFEINTSRGVYFNSMFRECTSIKKISGLDTSNGTTFTFMFNGCTSLVELGTIDMSSNDSNTFYMFQNCKSLVKLPTGISLKDVTDVSYMFNNCNSLNEIPTLDFSKVTSLSNTFNGCTNLKKLPYLDTSMVTTFTRAFYLCNSLRRINWAGTPSLVGDAQYMFNGCNSLVEVPTGLNLSGATKVDYLFKDCNSLRTIPDLDFSNVTSTTFAVYLFQNCYSLEQVPAMTNFSAFKNLTSMFDGCYTLKSVGALDTSLATNISNLFDDCYSLSSIGALNFNSVTTTNTSTFGRCQSLMGLGMTNLKQTVTLSTGTVLQKEQIIEVFTNLGTVSGKSITITGLPGAASLTTTDRAIATSKGWTIIG